MAKPKNTPRPILTDAFVQRDRIRQKAVESIKNVFPFKGERHTVDVSNVRVSPADIDPADYKSALLKARTLAEPIRGTLTLKDNKTGKVKEKIKDFNLMQLPYFTDHHTFIIKGHPYNVSNQLRMKPGVYTRKKRNADLVASFNLAKGDNFHMEMDQEKGLFALRYGSTKIPLYSVLSQLGVKDGDMTKAWNKDLVAVNKKAYGRRAEKDMGNLYSKIVRPLNRLPGETSVDGVRRVFGDTEMDPTVVRQTLGKAYDKVSPQALLAASGKLLHAYNNGDADFDERDNMAYKHLKSVDDFIGERVMLEARTLKNKVLSKVERGKSGLEAVPRSPFTKTVRNFLSTSALSSNPTQINPIEILDQASRVTSLGEGGISSDRAIPMDARRLHLSQIGVLDPVRTPESGRAGIDLRTTIYAGRDDGGNVYTLLHDARKRGKRATGYVPIEQAVEKTVAFPNQQMRGRVDAIRKGQIVSVPAREVDYVLPGMHGVYSPATNLVPLLDSIDGNRQTMAAKMQTQALPLKYSEAPLVRTRGVDPNSDYTMDEYFGGMAVPQAPISGTVSAIRNGRIYITPRGAKTAAAPEIVPYYQNFPLASKTYLHHDLTVKKGDTVKKGQAMANSDFVKDGAMSLGVNLNTAYVPVHGKNSNDAIVISEGAAKKLTSRHMYIQGMDLDSDTAANRTKHQTYFGNKYTKDMYDNMDKDGLVKPGTKVRKGDLLIASVQKSSLSPEAQMLGKLHKSLVKPFRDSGLTWDKDEEGEVVDVSRSGNKIRLTVKTENPMKIGDKISGRAGDKGVISAIIPDDQMLRDEEGKPIDVAISSASVISRINPGQVMEAALGKVARKTGKPVIFDNYQSRDNMQYVKDLLKKNGLKDTETLTDPETGKKLKNILVGPRHTLKLFKSTETNYSARGVDSHDTNQQPSSGGPKGAKGVGRLVFNSLLAHDARNILKESSILKSQKNDEWWRAYQLGMPLPNLRTTFAYDKFGAMLAGAGVNMNKRDNSITLSPLTDKDVAKKSAGEVRNSLFVRAKDLRPEKGGLFDPSLTGGTVGTKWSHFNLKEPVVSPLFERPVKSLLGVSQTEFDKILRDEGGAGIKKRLSKIDLGKRKAELKSSLNDLKGTDRDKALKQYGYIRALQKNGTGPAEAYTLSKIPVVPPQFRPILPGKRGDLQVSDANYLYRDAMLANDMLKDSKGLGPDVHGDARRHLYDAVGALFGDKDPVSPQLKSRNAKGFIKRITGVGGPKYGFVHDKLLRKRQDVSGRGTIAPDPTLGMDEIGIPEDMGWSMYQPMVTRRLVQRGYKAMDAKKMIEDRHPLARDMLLDETRTRPVLANRAPSLYRYNILAAYPKLIPGKTIRVHESLAPIMAGDFDGDAVQIFTPVTDKAVDEAKKMTLPNMLISDQSKFSLTKAAPQQEAVAGIYAATSAKASGKKRRFKNRGEAMRAYHAGEITLGTPVEIRK